MVYTGPLGPINKHTWRFNPTDNGGEQVVLETHFMKDVHGRIYTQHKIDLNSYRNVMSVNLGIEITPQSLRDLANELESMMIQVKNNG